MIFTERLGYLYGIWRRVNERRFIEGLLLDRWRATNLVGRFELKES
jgi:hypothetical protein